MKAKSKTNHHAEPTDADIQHTAYLLWIEAGRPEGKDLDHWLAAKELLRHAEGRDASTGPRSVEFSRPSVPAAHAARDDDNR